MLVHTCAKSVLNIEACVCGSLLCRCLYPPACTQAHSDASSTLYQQDTLDNSTQAAFLAAQCLEGHEGNLCGRCSKGFGPQMSATLQKCRPCASRSSVISAYLFAAIASTLVIKLLCALHAYYAAEDIARVAYTTSGPTGSAVPPAGKPSSESGPPTEAIPGASSATDHTGRFSAATASVEFAGGKDARGTSDNSSAARLEGGVPQRSGSGASGAARTPAWLDVATGGTPFGGAAPAQPKVEPGDLLKPFVVYLQVGLSPEEVP
jgi:hypothetical protein